ncbi:MAG: hypothetical protein FWG20_05635 [Candidatus Cloacimonetes bacterium]|nr:hypothetical protein [Candidatus Cloacimonadota bacterium]
MKKFFIVFFVFIAFQVSAQTQKTFNTADNVVGAGIEFGGKIYSDSDWKGFTHTPVFFVNYEHCVSSVWDYQTSIGVGGVLGLSSAKSKTDDRKIVCTIIGLRLSLHYALVKKLDTYGGLMAGYKIASAEFSEYKGKSELIPDLFLGARYYLADNFAVFGEAGILFFGGNAGISLKF